MTSLAVESMLVYVFIRKKVEEMKHLSQALEASIGQHAKTQERMLATIEKLAESLQPAVRQALNPIGQSVDSISLSSKDSDGCAAPAGPAFTFDRQTKELATNRKNIAITGPHQLSGVISELDMLTGSCKISVLSDTDPLYPIDNLTADPSKRTTAKIMDPVIGVPNNPYTEALSNASSITFTAKALIDDDGQVAVLYISDCDANHG